RQDGKAVVLNVQFEKLPATDAQLIVIGPNNDEQELKLDAAGSARIDQASPGEYAVRARQTVKTPAERDGKKKDEVRHYPTPPLKWAPNSGNPSPTAADNALAAVTSSTPAPSAEGDPAATALLRKAREGRAVWEHFPGFTADVTVSIDGKSESGTLAVDDS